MPQPTNPQAGVVQEAPDVNQRMQNFISQFEEDQEREVEQPETPERSEVSQPEGQASEEVTPEDLPAEAESTEQPAVDAFEIVHNGQQVKLSREEAIKYAMQGYDYTRKTEAVAVKDRETTQRLRQLQEIEQIVPLVTQGLAEVKALEGRLKQYQGVDWVQLAAQDTATYARHRAQFDALNTEYQGALQRFNQGYGHVSQRVNAIKAQRLQQEAQRLPEYVPDWKDPQKLDTARTEIARHYQQTYGVDPTALDSSLETALAMSVAYKAMLYYRLTKAKSEKVKQLRTAPPVTRPGASGGPNAASTAQAQQLESKLRKSGDVRDAAALLANRWK